MPLSSFDTLPAIEGVSTSEDLVRVGEGCSLDCPFCIYGRGRVGSRLADVLSPAFQAPAAGRVTILAGDVVRADLAPLVARLRRQGATDVLAYAHAGTRDLEGLRALHAAGLTGVYLVLPAASRELLSTLTGGRGTLARAAALIDAANGLGLSVAIEVPVVAANHQAIADTVGRALHRIARPDRVVLRFLSDFAPGRRGGWDHGLAAEAVSASASLAQARGVPLHLAHPHAPPPCVMDVPHSRPSMYPGFMIAGWSTTRPHPFAACASCDVAPVCAADGEHLSTGGREVAPITRDGGVKAGGETPPGSTGDGELPRGVTPSAPALPSSSELFLRQEALGSLVDALRRRPFRVCRFPWEELEAHDIRGVVTPCAGGWPRPETVRACASWHGATLLRAWNSPGMRAVRRAAAAGRPFDTCSRECPAFHGGPQTAFPAIPAPVTRRCFDNVVLNLREMLAGEEVLESRPQAISFSPTLRCTNRCRMCDIHERLLEMGDGPELHDMPDALFDELLDLLPTTRMLSLTGGEPLVSRRVRDLLRLFDADRYPDGGVTLTTNGLLLRQPLLSDLRRTPLRLVHVSLNAATEPTYELLTGTRGGFPRVLANVRGLLDAVATMAGRPTVLLSFVVQRSNFRELPAFLDLAAGMGTGVRLQPVERDRCGESVTTDEATLTAVLEVLSREVGPRLAALPRSFANETARVESILRGRLDRRDFTPL